MTNDGVLESSHQGDIVLAHMAGGRDHYKKYLCAEGKQTVFQCALLKELRRIGINIRGSTPTPTFEIFWGRPGLFGMLVWVRFWPFRGHSSHLGPIWAIPGLNLSNIPFIFIN